MTGDLTARGSGATASPTTTGRAPRRIDGTWKTCKMIAVHFYDNRPPLAVYSDVRLPPKQYDHAFAGTIQRHQFSASQVDAECRKYGLTGPAVQACAVRLGDDSCIVIMPWQGIGGVRGKDMGAVGPA